MKGFHLRSGLYFRRLPNRGVEIRKYSESGDLLDVIVVTDLEWASVLSAVSARGSTAHSCREAQHFHNTVRNDSQYGDLPLL